MLYSSVNYQLIMIIFKNQLKLGVTSVESLRDVLKARDPETEEAKSSSSAQTPKSKKDEKLSQKEDEEGSDKNPQLYTDSSTFLKV